jgi:hypothetical protein
MLTRCIFLFSSSFSSFPIFSLQVREDAEATVRLRLGFEQAEQIGTLERLFVRLTNLELGWRRAERLEKSAKSAHRIVVAVDGLHECFRSKQPLEHEVRHLRSVAASDTVISAALDSIAVNSLSQGVLSEAQLQQRFIKVKREVLRVSMVPQDGGMIS